MRPNQLEGWTEAKDKDAFALLEKDACDNIGDVLLVKSSEYSVKETAWKTVLRAGFMKALKWIDPAVTTEENMFMQQEILEWLACFRIQPLPEFVTRWIVEEYDIAQDGSDGREFSRRIAATRLARSLATRESFRSLARFGITHNKRSIDAICICSH